MIGMMMYGLIAVALAAAAGMSLMTFNKTSQQTAVAQENASRMEIATVSLRANLRAALGTGTLYAPMGSAGTGAYTYTQLPSWLGVVSTTPWGQPYLYCPVAPQNVGTGTATDTVTEPNNATYSVGVVNTAATGGKDYIIASSTTTDSLGKAIAANQGYVGFLVSNQGIGQSMPNCSDISISASGSPTIVGGSVRGITGGLPFTQRIIASANRTVIYVGAASSGDGTGVDASNLTTLDNAIGIWQALQPRVTEIVLTGGTQLSTASSLTLYDPISNTPVADPASAPTLIFNTNDGSSLNFTTAQTIISPIDFYNMAVTFPGTGSTSTGLTTKAPVIFLNASFLSPAAGTRAHIEGKLSFQNTSLKNWHIQAYSADITNSGVCSSTIAMSDVSYEMHKSNLSFVTSDCYELYTITNSADPFTPIFASSSHTFIGKGAKVKIAARRNIEFASGTLDIGDQNAQSEARPSGTMPADNIGYVRLANGAADGSSIVIDRGSLYLKLSSGYLDNSQTRSAARGALNLYPVPIATGLAANDGVQVNINGALIVDGPVVSAIDVDHGRIQMNNGEVGFGPNVPANGTYINGGFGTFLSGTGFLLSSANNAKNCISTPGETIVAKGIDWVHITSSITAGAGGTASGAWVAPLNGQTFSSFWASGASSAYVNSAITKSYLPDYDNLDVYCAQ